MTFTTDFRDDATKAFHAKMDALEKPAIAALTARFHSTQHTMHPDTIPTLRAIHAWLFDPHALRASPDSATATKALDNAIAELEALEARRCAPAETFAKVAEYQPEVWTVKKDAIYAAKSALAEGAAYTQELLANHDRDLGRTTHSNKLTAGHMEKAIADMLRAMTGLREEPYPSTAPAPTTSRRA